MISARIVRDKRTGEGKGSFFDFFFPDKNLGFGFLELADIADVKSLLDADTIPRFRDSVTGIMYENFDFFFRSKIIRVPVVITKGELRIKLYISNIPEHLFDEQSIKSDLSALSNVLKTFFKKTYKKT